MQVISRRDFIFFREVLTNVMTQSRVPLYSKHANKQKSNLSSFTMVLCHRRMDLP